MEGICFESLQSGVEDTGGPAKSFGVAVSLEETFIPPRRAHSDRYPAQAVADFVGPADIGNVGRGALSTRENVVPPSASTRSAGKFKAVNDDSTSNASTMTPEIHTGAFQQATIVSEDSHGLEGVDPHDWVLAEDWHDVADILQAQAGRASGAGV